MKILHSFSCSDCKSVDEQHPGTKLLNPQGTLQGDTFEVGIALLTAVSSRGRQCDGMVGVR